MKKRIQQQFMFLLMSLFILSCSDNFKETESNDLNLETLKEKYEFTTILHKEEPEYLKDLEPLTLYQIEAFLQDLIIPNSRSINELQNSTLDNNLPGIDFLYGYNSNNLIYSLYIEPTEPMIMNSVVVHSSWSNFVKYMHDYDYSYIYSNGDLIQYTAYGNAYLKAVDSTGLIEINTRTSIKTTYRKSTGKYISTTVNWNI